MTGMEPPSALLTPRDAITSAYAGGAGANRGCLSLFAGCFPWLGNGVKQAEGVGVGVGVGGDSVGQGGVQADVVQKKNSGNRNGFVEGGVRLPVQPLPGVGSDYRGVASRKLSVGDWDGGEGGGGGGGGSMISMANVTVALKMKEEGGVGF